MGPKLHALPQRSLTATTAIPIKATYPTSQLVTVEQQTFLMSGNQTA